MNSQPPGFRGEGFFLEVLSDSHQPPALPPPAVLEEVLEVYRQCEDFLALGPAPRASMEMVLSDLAFSREEGGRYCAIRAAGHRAMTGVVDFVLAGFEGDPRTGFLSLLMIGAPYRGAGLGEAVTRQVERAAWDAGARVMLLGVQVNNPRGIRFWQRMGYRQSSAPEDLPDGTRAMRMRKALPPPAEGQAAHAG